MDRTERFYKIDQLITERRIVPFQVLIDTLEVSPATIKRDLEYLRNRLNAPIIWDRTAGGYRYAKNDSPAGSQFELPGLWFNASEIHALLTMQHLLATLDQGGLLGPHIQPLMARLNGLLGTAENTVEEVRKRVRIIGVGARHMQLHHFEQVGSSLLRRKRLYITYRARGSNQITEREISPQRLVHYRDNWYLDAWCHLRQELRSFAVDSIVNAEILETTTKDLPEKTLDGVLGAGYGIFSGKKVQWAKLKFTAQRARWVAFEQWHPRQKSRFDSDGSYVLEIPYADDRELVMDIMKHGAEVEVLAPPQLRERVINKLREAAQQYDLPEQTAAAAG